MSGFEVVGVVLGSLSLIISGLEHYRQSAEVFEDWWEFKRAYKKCITALEMEEQAFQNIRDVFLVSTTVSEEELEVLRANPFGDEWKDPVLEEKLRARLPRSYDLFLNTIGEYQETMERLKKELNLENATFQEKIVTTTAKPPKTKRRHLRWRLSTSVHPKVRDRSPQSGGEGDKMLSRQNLEFQAKRLKFCLSKSTYTELLEDLARCNARLNQILNMNDKYESLKQARMSSGEDCTLSKITRSFWRHAAIFHDLLGQSWCCQCKHLHHLHLLLHQETNIKQVEFGIWISYNPLAIDSGNASPWGWKDIIAHYVETETSNETCASLLPTKVSSPHPALTSAPKPILKSRDAPRSASRPKVNWAVDVAPPDPGASIRASNTPVIMDLCTAVATSRPEMSQLGVLEGDQESYVLKQNINSDGLVPSGDVVSLAQLLSKAAGVKLVRRHMCNIAFILASSHLQLYPSPWLSSQWTKANVVFPTIPGNPPQVRFDRPYLRKEVLSLTSAQVPSCASKDRALPRLAILLTELGFMEAIEEQKDRLQAGATTPEADNAVTHALVDLGLTIDWSRSVGDHAGEPYAAAVRWCLYGPKLDPENDKWRDELYANVVKPLQSCYENFLPAFEVGQSGRTIS